MNNTAPELQLPNLDKSEADYLPEEREEHGENTEYITSPPLLSTNTTEDMGMGEADEPDQIPSQNGPEKRITRFRGLKHVPIYNTEIVKTTKKSILKDTYYKLLHNFQPDKIRIIPEDQFLARLEALEIHRDICNISFCENCRLSNQVSGYKFNPGDYSRYVDKQALLHPLNTLKNLRSLQRVYFNERTLDNEMKPYERVPINLAMIEKACRCNVSFKELGTYKN